MRYLPLTDTDRSAMLDVIGAPDIDALFADVPEEARLSGPIEGLPMHASEMAVEKHMRRLSKKNLAAADAPFFLGAGAYRHHVPASVDHIIQRGEFLTAYTPYQPEIAQGTLQMLFEFQSQVARLYGCAVANASMYDGSTACWEAVAMAGRVARGKKRKVVLSGALHPHYAEVVRTMAKFTDDEIAGAPPSLTAKPDDDGLIARIDADTSCVVVQYPDILGRLPDLAKIAAAAHDKGALLIAVNTEPVALGAIKSPGELGADIVVGEGALQVAGVPAKSISWADLASAAVEQEIEGGLAHELDFDGSDATYPFGSHVAVVEIDRETGEVDLLRHIAVDDCGTILNPMLVNGQQHGGIAQGIAQALWEHVQYDEDANPVTASLMDYLMPSAAELPSFEVSNTETASPRNPLGAKGIGESGTIGSTPAVHNAVCDAVAHLGVEHVDMPCTPQAVWQALQSV